MRAAHCARREKSRDKWGTGRRAAKARGAENGDAMRRKGAARGARHVMSEGVRGRSEARAAHCVRRVMYRGRDGERGRRVSEAPNTVIQYKDRFGSLHAAEVKLGDALVSKGTPVS